jgi:uncharacterized membrane protein
MGEERDGAHRLATYSDAVFAVIVTIMVLELRAPEEPAFSALWPLWPTLISYAASYLFIAVIWINHHYLWRFVGPPTLRLIWINFIHLFMVSLLPFATNESRGTPTESKTDRDRCPVLSKFSAIASSGPGLLYHTYVWLFAIASMS